MNRNNLFELIVDKLILGGIALLFALFIQSVADSTQRYQVAKESYFEIQANFLVKEVETFEEHYANFIRKLPNEDGELPEESKGALSVSPKLAQSINVIHQYCPKINSTSLTALIDETIKIVNKNKNPKLRENIEKLAKEHNKFLLNVVKCSSESIKNVYDEMSE